MLGSSPKPITCAALCGDSYVGPGEQCDDGNFVNTDACTNICQNARCGDSFIQPGEQCDDGNVIPTDACIETCQNAVCGDGRVRAGFEQCDDGNAINNDACSNSCVTAVCGDLICNGAETELSCNQDCSCTITTAFDNCGIAACPACIVGYVKAFTNASQSNAQTLVDAGYRAAITNAIGYYAIGNVTVGLHSITAIPQAPWTASKVTRTLSLGINIINITVGTGSSQCKPDCSTQGNDLCEQSCHGTNDCFFFNDQTKSVCDGRPVYSLRAYSPAEEVLCCEGAPYNKLFINDTASVNATNFFTITRTVFLGGKLVQMKVVVFR